MRFQFMGVVQSIASERTVVRRFAVCFSAQWYHSLEHSFPRPECNQACSGTDRCLNPGLGGALLVDPCCPVRAIP